MRLRLLTISLSLCLILSMTGCGNSSSATPASESSSESPLTVADSDAVPCIEETFDETLGSALARGSVTLEQTLEGEDGSGALKITGRTDSWNGVNFDGNAFRGNTISANASLKGESNTFHISIQYDLDGSTVYSWITTSHGNADRFVTSVGSFTIPENAENIFVYIESDDTGDILVDSFTIKVSGDYKVPGEIKPIQMADTSGYPSLRETYSDYFDIGVAVNPATVSGEYYPDLICRQFSSITNENNLKPDTIIDKNATLSDTENNGTRLVLDFSKVSSELDFAVANNLKVRGHTLIWHSQTPEWIFYENFDPEGELASRELMLTRMENYIHDVFTFADTNYPGLFYAWDIVNEAVDDSGGLRNSLWRQTIGDDYIEQAFAFARKYAPEGIALFYNDYNSYQPGKQSDIIHILEPVAQSGNLDGMGMQGHIDTTVNSAAFVNAAKKYAQRLNVVIHITELDISQPDISSDPAADQGAYFHEFFTAVYEGVTAGVPIESVTFWGLTDPLSWKAGDKPLLFEGDLTAKPAFYKIIEALEQKKSEEAP